MKKPAGAHRQKVVLGDNISETEFFNAIRQVFAILGITMALSIVTQSNQHLPALLPNAGSGLSLTTPVIAGKKELFA